MALKLLDYLRFPVTPKADAENNAYAKATTPDRLIAAHLIQSFTLDFKNWTAHNLEAKWTETSSYREPNRTLVNHDKGFEIKWENDEKHKKYHGQIYKLNSRKASLNGVKLDEESSRLIIIEWDRISIIQGKIQEAADKALQEMKLNETKWNMAEKMLKMKRNKMGALMPIETAE